MLHSVNPYTEEQFSSFPELSPSELNTALDLASQAAALWSKQTIKARTQCVLTLAKELARHKKELALLMTQEMGKPIGQAEAEIQKSISLCQYTAGHAELFLRPRTKLPSAPAGAYVVYRPLGVILGIMPWNFPVWQVCRFALPALLSGNTVLIKHAPNVTGSALCLQKIFLKAGFPKGVYQNLVISVPQTALVIQDQRVQGVSLTGSVKAGREAASLAGRFLKKTVLELGGSDAYLILDSADLELASQECVSSRMINNGQSCIAAKRFIVTQKNADSFIDKVLQKMKYYKMDDPSLPAANLGPCARKDLRLLLHQQVEQLKVHAELVLGGEVPQRKGYFYPPTVLASRKGRGEAASFQEELFGPAALVIVVGDEEEGIEAANQSCYGLGAGVFGADLEKAERIARDHLHAGACVVNKALHSHPALPFGGIKDSGYGRELAEWGFYEFMNIKTIQI